MVNSFDTVIGYDHQNAHVVSVALFKISAYEIPAFLTFVLLHDSHQVTMLCRFIMCFWLKMLLTFCKDNVLKSFNI